MIDLKIVRYDESNKNIEGLKGQYAQLGDKNAAFTVIKNLLFINLHSGVTYNNERLPTVYDGFVQCSDGSIITVKDSTLTCKLANGVTGFGVLVLKKWN